MVKHVAAVRTDIVFSCLALLFHRTGTRIEEESGIVRGNEEILFSEYRLLHRSKRD